MSNRDKKSFYTAALVLLLQLASLIFIKYYNQNLSIYDFNPWYIGNMFLIIIYIILIAGFVFNSFNTAVKTSKIIINIYLTVTWILIATAFISSLTDPGLNKIYLFGQTGNKLLTGLLYSSYLVIFISFIVYVWGNILFRGNFLFLNNIYSSVLILLIFLVLTFIYAGSISNASGKSELEKNNKSTAVVLGAAVWSGNLPSPTLSDRVDKAIELVNKGYAGKIFLTGSSAPGEITEALAALNYLLAKGFDTSFVSIETGSTSTTEQIKFIKRELAGRKSPGDIIIISDAYHLPRIIEIAGFMGLKIKVTASDHPLSFGDKFYNITRECIALFIFWCFAL